MSQKDKVLDVLALSDLTDDARIARLASKQVDKALPVDQAKAIVRCFFPNWRGRLVSLADKLVAEKCRQERIRDDRRAVHLSTALSQVTTLDKYKSEVRLFAQDLAYERACIRYAQARFGNHIRENFNDETLALMDLISTDVKRYVVDWLSATAKPTLSAVIQVTVIGRVATHVNNFLIYGTNGRVMIATTNQATAKQAWIDQLPQSLAAAIPALVRSGYKLHNDRERQVMMVTAPDGLVQEVPWTGRTVED